MKKICLYLLLLACAAAPHSCDAVTAAYNRLFYRIEELYPAKGFGFDRQAKNQAMREKVYCISASDMEKESMVHLRRMAAEHFLAVAYTPQCFIGKKRAESFLLRTSRKAAAIPAALVVDCSQADFLRRFGAGFTTIAVLRRAGVKRMVVFDGAHHLTGLALMPDLILLPVMDVGSERYICHGFVRDAVPLRYILHIIRRNRLPISCVISPRFATCAKTPGALRDIIIRMIRECPAAIPGVRKEPLPAAEIIVNPRYQAAFLPGGDVLLHIKKGGWFPIKGNLRLRRIYAGGVPPGKIGGGKIAQLTVIDRPHCVYDLLWMAFRAGFGIYPGQGRDAER
ncbi:MAG: hypothetical protein ACM3WV_05385 [Bacillota bacterium]